MDYHTKHSAGPSSKLQNALIRNAVDSIADGVMISGLDYQIIYANPAQGRLYGRDPSDLIGHDARDLVVPAAHPDHIMARVLEEGRWEGEITGIRDDGTTFPLRQAIYRINDDSGQPAAVVAISRDISAEKIRKKSSAARRQSQEDLQRTARQLEDLLETSRELNSALDTAGVLRMLVNHGMSLVSAAGGFAGLYKDDKMVLSEYHRDSEILQVDFTFRAGYGVPGWIIERREPYITDDAEHDSQVIAHIQKQLGFIRLLSVPVIDSNGVLLGCLELHNPASARPFNEEDVRLITGLANQAAVALRNAVLNDSLRASAEELRRNEETLRLVVEGSPDFFFYIHDANGIFTYVSSTVEDITGHSVEEWKSHYTRFLTDSPINERAIEYTERMLRTGEVTPSYPIEVVHKSGRRIMLEVFERPIQKNGEITGIRGVARDVTELKRIEAIEKRLSQEAEAHKRRFYRDTIFSVTDGKLIIMDPDQTQALCADPLFPPMQITEAKDISLARDEIHDAAIKAGMDESQVRDLILAVGEAATNALKHAGGGTICMVDGGDMVRVGIYDQGPGMDSLALPMLTLKKGHSTQRSLGMGYATILTTVDKVYLSTDPSGTSVVLEVAKQPKPAEVEVENLPDLW